MNHFTFHDIFRSDGIELCRNQGPWPQDLFLQFRKHSALLPIVKVILKMIFQGTSHLPKNWFSPGHALTGDGSIENVHFKKALSQQQIRYSSGKFFHMRSLNVMVDDVLHIFLLSADYFRFTIFNGISPSNPPEKVCLLQMLFLLRCQNWRTVLFLFVSNV